MVERQVSLVDVHEHLAGPQHAPACRQVFTTAAHDAQAAGDSRQEVGQTVDDARVLQEMDIVEN